MKFYLFRKAPRGLNHITAHEAAAWNVIMILKSRSIRVSPNILYQSSKTGVVYVQLVEESDYDLMDAFGIPHATRNNFSVVVPQEILDPNYNYHISTKRDKWKIILTARRLFGPHKGATSSVNLYPRMG